MIRPPASAGSAAPRGARPPPPPTCPPSAASWRGSGGCPPVRREGQRRWDGPPPASAGSPGPRGSRSRPRAAGRSPPARWRGCCDSATVESRIGGRRSNPRPGADRFQGPAVLGLRLRRPARSRQQDAEIEVALRQETAGAAGSAGASSTSFWEIASAVRLSVSASAGRPVDDSRDAMRLTVFARATRASTSPPGPPPGPPQASPGRRARLAVDRECLVGPSRFGQESAQPSPAVRQSRPAPTGTNPPGPRAATPTAGRPPSPPRSCPLTRAGSRSRSGSGRRRPSNAGSDLASAAERLPRGQHLAVHRQGLFGSAEARVQFRQIEIRGHQRPPRGNVVLPGQQCSQLAIVVRRRSQQSVTQFLELALLQ